MVGPSGWPLYQSNIANAINGEDGRCCRSATNAPLCMVTAVQLLKALVGGSCMYD